MVPLAQVRHRVNTLQKKMHLLNVRYNKMCAFLCHYLYCVRFGLLLVLCALHIVQNK